MMSIRVVNAGDGYAYLLRNVATANVGSGTKPNSVTTTKPPVLPLAAGTGADSPTSTPPPSQQAQLSPRSTWLHSTVRGFTPRPTPVSPTARPLLTYNSVAPTRSTPAAIKCSKSYRPWRNSSATTLGAGPPSRNENTIAVDVARKHYSDETSYSNATPKEILAWVNEKKNSVRQATAGFDLTFSPAKSISVL
nr:hypothetical protein [uncultured Corynebacterium sp.]